MNKHILGNIVSVAYLFFSVFKFILDQILIGQINIYSVFTYKGFDCIWAAGEDCDTFIQEYVFSIIFENRGSYLIVIWCHVILKLPWIQFAVL